MKTPLLFFLLISSAILFSQNLVPNPDFESYNSCPTAQSMIAECNQWSTVPGSITTPDYFNACYNLGGTGCPNVDVPLGYAGNVNAHSGNGFAGIISYYTGCPNCREYIMATLNNSLTAGQTYNIGFWCIRPEWDRYATDRIGMYISGTMVNQPGNQPVMLSPTIQSSGIVFDSLNWTLVSTTYIAVGGERYVTIGNFYDNAQTAVFDYGSSSASCALANSGGMYFIDDVFVIPQTTNQISVFGDTLICNGDTAMLYATGDTSVWWSTLAQPAVSIGNNDTVFVNPNTNTLYIAHGTGDDDTITVTVVASLNLNLGNDTTVCTGQQVVLASNLVAASYLWSTGATTNSIIVTAANSYSLTVSNINCSDADTAVVSITPLPVVNLGSDTTVCNSAPVILNAGNAGANYLWSNAATAQTISVNTPGNYSVTVTANGCSASDDVNIFFSNALSVNLGNDTAVCPGNVVLLDVGNAGMNFLWNTLETTQTILVNTPGLYFVQVTDGTCFGVDSILISNLAPPVFNIGNDTSVCAGNSVTLGASVAGANYLWSDNSTTPFITVSNAGMYWLEVNMSGCTARDSATVSTVNVLPVFLGNDTGICSGTQITLNAIQTNANYLWSDSSTSSMLVASTSGNYSVTVSIGNCSVNDVLNLSVQPLPLVNIGNDTSLCAGAILILDAQNAGANYLWSDNSIVQQVTVTQQGNYSVTVSVNNCTADDAIAINYFTSATLELGNDTALCNNYQLVLDATIPYPATYYWNGVQQQAQFRPQTTGTYTANVIYNCGTLSDSVHVVFNNCRHYYFIPNSFTPNGDGNNDYFEIFGNKETWKQLEIKLFNRWGEKVFESTDINFKWDGKYKSEFLSPSVLVYQLYIVFDDNTTEKHLTGSVTLLR